jgi:SNF2 family DNA or RNA helicase
MTLNQGSRLVNFKTVVGYKNLDRLRAKIAPWSAVVTKAECLDLPPKVYETYKVDLTDDQRRTYDQLHETCVAELSDGSVVTASMALVKLLRLQQVLCGYAPNEDGEPVKIGENRVAALLEVLAEASGKAIIWSRFVHPIREIATALRREYGPRSTLEYYGATSIDDRRDAIREFQEGEARFLVGNQQTGGYGITLTAASTVIYYANSFDLEARLQSEDRCHRIGQKKSVTYVDLVAPKTVDEKILKALRDKRKISDMLMVPGGWRELI